MLVVISSELCLPPSSVSCFRDFTLYATIFCSGEVLVEAEDDFKDPVWRWLKRHGAMDFVEDLLPPLSRDSHEAWTLRPEPWPAHLRLDRLNEATLSRAVAAIPRGLS